MTFNDPNVDKDKSNIQNQEYEDDSGNKILNDSKIPSTEEEDGFVGFNQSGNDGFTIEQSQMRTDGKDREEEEEEE
jgi:hypothetical protein